MNPKCWILIPMIANVVEQGRGGGLLVQSGRFDSRCHQDFFCAIFELNLSHFRTYTTSLLGNI